MFLGSTFAEKTDYAFYFVLGVSLLLLIFITFLMIYFVFKYSREKHPRAVNIHSSLALEITWTIIPVIIVLAMFWYGWVGYQQIANPPANTFNVKVTGQMWKWSFEYANGLRTDTLYVPKDKPVLLNLTSLDVNHSFYVPAYRFKMDVFPNKETEIWFLPDELGDFDIACAEYCGLRHSYMYSKVVVLPQDKFDDWYYRGAAVR